LDTEADEGAGAPGYFLVLDVQGGRIAAIRDFRYARYAAELLPA
jgi:hypothetical protein